MSVYTSNSKAGPYAADGSQRMFPFAFPYLEDEHVSVYLGSVKVSREDYLVERPAGYIPETDNIAGGSVVFFDPPAAGNRVTILREVPITQETDIQNNTAFYPEVVEDGLDKLTMVCQQLMEIISRCVQVPPGEGSLEADALLQMILQNAEYVENRLRDFLPLAGGFMKGDILRQTDEARFALVGASAEGKGAALVLNGEQGEQGKFQLTAAGNGKSAGLVGYPDGRLFWNGCEAVTKCNLSAVLKELGIEFEGGSGSGGGGNNNDDVDPPFDDDEDDEDDTGGGGDKPGDNVGSTVTGDTSRGYIAVAGTNRTLSLNISPWSGSTDEETCTTTDYFAGIYSNTAEERFFEKLRTVVGEIEEGEDGTECIPWIDPMPWGCEDGELYFYRNEEPVYPRYDPDAAAEGMSEIAAQIIEGDIHDKVVGIPGGGPYPADEWDGYKWYGRPGGFGDWGITCHNQGDLISGSHGVNVSWYNAWGESPCDDGSSLVGTTYSIHVFTMKFSWIPGDDYSGARPKKVVIGHPDGTRRAYEFDVEYCLEGHPSNWAHPEWAKVVPCGSHCRWPMFQAIRDKMPDVDYSDDKFTEGGFYYPAIEETPQYTYEGVIFEGEEEV